jgi:hypothetical protein
MVTIGNIDDVQFGPTYEEEQEVERPAEILDRHHVAEVRGACPDPRTAGSSVEGSSD